MHQNVQHYSGVFAPVASIVFFLIDDARRAGRKRRFPLYAVFVHSKQRAAIFVYPLLGFSLVCTSRVAVLSPLSIKDRYSNRKSEQRSQVSAEFSYIIRFLRIHMC